MASMFLSQPLPQSQSLSLSLSLPLPLSQVNSHIDKIEHISAHILNHSIIPELFQTYQRYDIIPNIVASMKLEFWGIRKMVAAKCASLGNHHTITIQPDNEYQIKKSAANFMRAMIKVEQLHTVIVDFISYHFQPSDTSISSYMTVSNTISYRHTDIIAKALQRLLDNDNMIDAESYISDVLQTYEVEIIEYSDPNEVLRMLYRALEYLIISQVITRILFRNECARAMQVHYCVNINVQDEIITETVPDTPFTTNTDNRYAHTAITCSNTDLHPSNIPFIIHWVWDLSSNIYTQ